MFLVMAKLMSADDVQGASGGLEHWWTGFNQCCGDRLSEGAN